MSVPDGYSIHEAVDLGGRMTNTYGSAAMYDTLVNLHSGPRVQGETFQLHVLPGHKGGLVDELRGYSTGFGGDPYNFARLDFSKGKYYDFTGMFRRDRQYFDYNLLGNPDIPNGQSIAIGPSAAPTGSIPWQLAQTPFLFNTVRRMTDTNLTLFPVSQVSLRLGYSQNIFAGPSLTPSGYFFAGGSDVVLQEMQRNSSDEYTVGMDWKPLPQTRVSLSEIITHIKADSYFTVNPASMFVQEPDGQRVALLANYDGLAAPTFASLCNAGSAGGSTTLLTAAQTPGGLPVINPACAVISSYLRSQPIRTQFPTQIVRLQSSSIPNVTMNGDVRYTRAKMNMPNYYENFEGLTKASSGAGAATRALDYSASAWAKRATIAVDYGIVWQATKTFSLAEQVDYSNVHQPGSAVMNSSTTVTTAAGAPNQTINSTSLTTTQAKAGSVVFEDFPGIGLPSYGYFGQKFLTDSITARWDASPRTTISLTYRHELHDIATNYTSATGTFAPPEVVTIHENGGILSAAFRPATNWSVNGTVEMLYHDNAFTPVAARQTQHYKFRTMYRPRPWATVSGSYNDVERHNNTNNTGAPSPVGPLGHVDHSRFAAVGADIAKSEHYGFNFNYAYSSVYTSTNTCYTAIQTAGFPGAAPPNGSQACFVSTSTIRGGAGQYEFGPVKDFMDAPTQSATVALALSPNDRFHGHVGYNISAVNGTRWFNNARDVNGSLVSTYQSPFVSAEWTVRKGLSWNGQYNYYGYGEGGLSGAQYCSTGNPTSVGGAPPTTTVVACSTLPGTAINGPAYGFTAPRNFHANNVALGVHYEF